MGKNVEHIQHIKSNVVLEGKPKLPQPGVLVEGELAINYAKGLETISIENTSGEVVTFSSDNYYTEQKLGSGFTGENSAVTVTDVIEENEEIISAALTDLDERKLDASAYTPSVELWEAGSGNNAAVLKNSSGTASGDYSVAEGLKTSATTYEAHAEGLLTSASGTASHAEGYSTTAGGNYSHAEGNYSQATGNWGAHAEGNTTTASGNSSHAEGNLTKATGDYGSHAEGSQTLASGQYSHAEGEYTSATTFSTHAEGANTLASGSHSHAEGYRTQATGDYGSHAEGGNTLASGQYSHAEGRETEANGYASHAEGAYTIANNPSEHASGQYNVSNTASTEFGDSGNTLFSVGNGSYNARHNAFEIRQNGDIYIVSGGTDILLQDNLGGNITIDQVLDDTTSASTNPVSSKAVYDAVTDNELVWTNAYVAMSGIVSAHTANTEIHVTAADKEKLHTHSNKTALDSITGNVGTMAYQNANSYSSATEVNTALGNKANISDLNDFFDDAKYEDSGTTKVINFYHGNTIKATIDASDFIVDGMVDDVRIENGNLVIDFNTASGKQDISIPLTDIFDPSNYYDKDDIDTLVGSGFTSSSITDVIIENEQIVSASLTDLDERKLDASAYTPSVELWEAGTGLNSVVLKNSSGTASGNYSVAEGYSYEHNGETYTSIASGSYSHTEGSATIASGDWGSHAEGDSTSATSDSSHAEGFGTLADGNSSHAEGNETLASGNHSHAEGLSTSATSYQAHAEGNETKANGNSSHAEGNETKASGDYSHAEGDSTSATSDSSHAEGYGTLADGYASHAEGMNTTASGGFGSHAEGQNTIASGGYGSHAEGQNTIASDSSSHAEGDSTSATSDASHAEGYGTLASGDYSHAEGEETIASGYNAHAEGRATKASGNASHAEGVDNEAIGDFSHTEGTSTLASGDYGSHAEGDSTSATSDSSHAEGSYTLAGGDYSHAEGDSTSATSDSSHAEGSYTIASGKYSHAEGSETIASGDYSHAEGNSTSASGESSHAEGQNTFANGYVSHAEGQDTEANGWRSHTEGFATIANNQSEHASGQYNASNSATTTFGDSGNTLFSVGNGTADNARHNAFEIRQNGDIYIISGSTDIKLQDNIGKVEVISAITPSNSGSTSPIATKVVAENELTVSNALTDLDNRKLDASAYTPTDLSNYYTKSETSGATEISNALGGKVNSATFTGHTADTTAHFTSGEKAAWGTFSAETNASINDLSGQSETIAAALNDLNENKADKEDLGGLKLVKVTQAQYDALTVKDPNTLYVIVN